MHIVFFNRSYYPDRTATGQLLTELCEGLALERDLRVSVVTGAPTHIRKGVVTNYPPLVSDRHNRVRIIRAYSAGFPQRRAICRFANYLSYFFSSLLAGLFLQKPDIIVSLTDPPIIGLVGLLWARIYHAKFVFWCQDVFPEVAILLEDFRNETLNRALDRTNRFLLRRADRVIAIGETMKRRLVEVKNAEEQKIEVIHNWADCEKIYPVSGPNRFGSQNGLNEKFVVMHSGNIGLSQNMEKIIEAARILRKEKDIIFSIVGEGNKKSELERITERYHLDNVTFLPYQPKELLSYSFSAADLFIISLKKGLAGYIVPSKLYGILASGRPFVAAVESECEISRIAGSFDCGVVIPPGDPNALASAIQQLYQNPERLIAMGKRAREAARDYDRKVALTHFEQLLKNSLALSIR